MTWFNWCRRRRVYSNSQYEHELKRRMKIVDQALANLNAAVNDLTVATNGVVNFVKNSPDNSAAVQTAADGIKAATSALNGLIPPPPPLVAVQQPSS